MIVGVFDQWIRLESAGLLDELPFQLKFESDFGGQSFDAEDFGCVVAAGIEVEPEFLCHVEMVLAQLPCDEGVDAVGEQVWHCALAAASEDADALWLFAAIFDGVVGVGEEGL